MTAHDSTANHFQVGQRWRCQGRSADEQPTLLINEISTHPLGGQIFHISLQAFKVRNPRTPGVLLSELAYLPVTLPTLQHSGLQMIDSQPINPAYREGRQQWQAAFDAGNAGAYGNTIAAILTLVEKQLHGIENVPPQP